MENKQNAQQKKSWVTPELFIESVKDTEGKSYHLIEIGESTGPS